MDETQEAQQPEQPESERLVWYSDKQINAAMNAAADLIQGDADLSLTASDNDLINLVVNAAGSLLITPSMSLDDIIRENYDLEPEIVRGWVMGA